MTDNKKTWHETKLEEARNASLAQQRADIDYIAMMCDVELGEDAREVDDAQ